MVSTPSPSSHAWRSGSPWKDELTDLATSRSGSPVTTSWNSLPGSPGRSGESGSSESWRTKTTGRLLAPALDQGGDVALAVGLSRRPQYGSAKAFWTSTTRRAGSRPRRLPQRSERQLRATSSHAAAQRSRSLSRSAGASAGSATRSSGISGIASGPSQTPAARPARVAAPSAVESGRAVRWTRTPARSASRCAIQSERERPPSIRSVVERRRSPRRRRRPGAGCRRSPPGRGRRAWCRGSGRAARRGRRRPSSGCRSPGGRGRRSRPAGRSAAARRAPGPAAGRRCARTSRPPRRRSG